MRGLEGRDVVGRDAELDEERELFFGRRHGDWRFGLISSLGDSRRGFEKLGGVEGGQEEDFDFWKVGDRCWKAE